MSPTTEYPLISLPEGIKVIVITGGPCSGKTTSLSTLSEKLSDRGYKVLVVPETATKLITAGMLPHELPPREFQEEILFDTLFQESRFHSIATRYLKQGRKVVILCDRGVLDGEAYITEKEFSDFIHQHGYTHRELCDGRYHAVLHLRTTALGAEQHYTLLNNTARTETLDVARALDEKTLQAWTRHEHPRVIDNSTDFEGKIRRVFAEVCGILGDPIPLENEDKFLIASFDPATLPVKWHASIVTQDYLVSPTVGEEKRVRMRESEGSATYYYTSKKPVSTGSFLEEQKMISEREYRALLTLRDPSLVTIKKRRVCFFWKEQFFEVDLFIKPEEKTLALMEAERTDRKPTLSTPPFIRIFGNVTGDKRYSNRSIAEHGFIHYIV